MREAIESSKLQLGYLGAEDKRRELGYGIAYDGRSAQKLGFTLDLQNL